MKILTLLNEKGGVGKTTLAAHVGAGLALAGKRVLLVDADPQGSLTLMLGFEPEGCFYDLIVRDEPFSGTVRPVSPDIYEKPGYESRGKLYLIPGNTETRSIANQIDDAFKVQQVFEALHGSIDVVIFDTAPTPSLLHGSIYLATHGILYPTLCETMAFHGLVDSLAHLAQANERRAKFGMAPVDILGIVPTMYRAKVLEHKENLADLTAQYPGLVWSPISQSILWAESARLSRMVWTHAPESQPARQALAMTARVMQAVV